MKIGITCYPTYGGSGVVATELGIELAPRGHEVHFITYAPPIRLTERHPLIHFHEVSVSQYPLFEYPPYDLALATRMAEVADSYRLDLLHVHYAIPHSTSAYLAKQMLAQGRNGSRRSVGARSADAQGPSGARYGVASVGYAKASLPTAWSGLRPPWRERPCELSRANRPPQPLPCTTRRRE